MLHVIICVPQPEEFNLPPLFTACLGLLIGLHVRITAMQMIVLLMILVQLGMRTVVSW